MTCTENKEITTLCNINLFWRIFRLHFPRHGSMPSRAHCPFSIANVMAALTIVMPCHHSLQSCPLVLRLLLSHVHPTQDIKKLGSFLIAWIAGSKRLPFLVNSIVDSRGKWDRLSTI